MTCIAALVHNGEVYMAGDSAVTNGSWDLVLHATPKVFRRGEVLIGVAGRSRLLNVVEHGLDVPPLPLDDADIARYAVVDFVNALRATLSTAGHMGQEDGRDKLEGGLLLGIRGRIIEVGNDLFTCEGRSDYFAIGDGDDLALGSLYSTAGRVADPVERLTLALAAAERHKASVRRPFVVLGPEDVAGRETGGPIENGRVAMAKVAVS